MRWLSSVLLALLLSGCVGRDVVAVTIWEQRGETVGDLSYIYCTRATHRERLMFLWGVQRTLGPHKITITCHPEGDPTWSLTP